MIRVKQISIPVRDQEASLKFYTEKLGFEVKTDQSMGGDQRWIELKAANSDVNIVLFMPPGQENLIGTFSTIMFCTDDVEKTYNELVERGVEFVQPLKKEPWGSSAVFKDIDGNSFHLGDAE